MESPLNKKIQRSLERTAAKKKKDSNYVPVLTLRQQVLSLVTEANKSAQSERQVTPRSALIVMDRALASLAVVDEESRDFAVLREVSSFISTAQKTSIMTASAHTDLLPQGHPLSALNASLTPEEYRFKYAQWLAADTDVSSAARPLVAAAFSAKPGSIERDHAFMRLRVTTENVPGYFKLDPAPIIAAFSDGNSSAARRARVALQWRDKRGRWVEMGRGANFRYRTSDGGVASASGVYVGVRPKQPGDNYTAGLIQVSGDKNLPDGIYAVRPSNTETYSARVPLEALEKAGITPGATPSQSMVGVPSQDEILATRKDAPEGWKKNSDNTFTSDDNYTVKGGDGEYTLYRQNEDGSLGDKVGEAANWAEINELANNDQDAYDEVKGQASSPEAREQVKARIATRTKHNEEFDRLEELVKSGVDQNGNKVPAGWEGIVRPGRAADIERRAIGADRVLGEEGLPRVEYRKAIAYDYDTEPVYAEAAYDLTGKFAAYDKRYDSWEEAEADIPRWIAAEEKRRDRKLEPIATIPSEAEGKTIKLPDGYSLVQADNPLSENIKLLNIKSGDEVVGFVAWDKDTKVVENIKVDAAHRGKKLAQAAWAEVKKIEPGLQHSEYRTPDGDRFAHSTGDYVPPLIPMGDWTQRDLDEANARAERAANQPPQTDYRAGFFDKDGNRLPGPPADDDPRPALTEEQKKKIDAEIRDLIENPPAPTEMDKRVEKLLREQRAEWDKAKEENYARIFDLPDTESALEFPTLFNPDKPLEEADDFVGVDPERLAKLAEDIKAFEEKWAEIDRKNALKYKVKKKKGPFKNLKKLEELEGIQMLKVKGADGVETESPVAEFSDRPMVLVNVNGVRIPFYISTGMGGKKEVPVGEWYPIFGIKDGWFNKGDQDEINDYYGSPELKEVAQWLNSNMGDIRAENIPQIAETDEEEFAEQQLNRDVAPVGYGRNPFLNIREAVARISGDEARIAEVEEMKANKKDDALEQVRRIQEKVNAQAKDIYDRRMAGESLDKVAKDLGLTREEVRRIEAKYARENAGAVEEAGSLPTEGVIEGTDVRYEIKTGPGQLGGRMRDGRVRNRERAEIEGDIAVLYLTGDTSNLKLPELERNGIWRGQDGGDRNVILQRPTPPHPMAGDPVEDAKKIVAQLNEENRSSGKPPSGGDGAGPGEPPSGGDGENTPGEGFAEYVVNLAEDNRDLGKDLEEKLDDDAEEAGIELMDQIYEDASDRYELAQDIIDNKPDDMSDEQFIDDAVAKMREQLSDIVDAAIQERRDLEDDPALEVDFDKEAFVDAGAARFRELLQEEIDGIEPSGDGPGEPPSPDFTNRFKEVKELAESGDVTPQQFFDALFKDAKYRLPTSKEIKDYGVPKDAKVFYIDEQNTFVQHSDGTWNDYDLDAPGESGGDKGIYDFFMDNFVKDTGDVSMVFYRGAFIDDDLQSAVEEQRDGDGDGPGEPPTPPSGGGDNTPGGGFADYVVDLAEDNSDLGKDLEERLEDDAADVGAELMDQMYDDASRRYELADDIADNKPEGMSNDEFVRDAVAKMRKQLSDIADSAIDERRALGDDEADDIDFDKDAFIDSGAKRFEELLREELDNMGEDDEDGGDEPPTPPSGGTPPKTPSPSAPSAPSLYKEFDVPNGAFELRGVDYEPEGRVDERSSDFTDDPEKLATKFSVEDLIAAFSEAILGNSSDASVAEILNANVGDDDEIDAPSEVDVNVNMPQVALGSPSGAGRLEFNAGEEFVLAESLFNALWHAGVDPNRVLANLYDSVNGDNKNLSKLIEAQGGTPSPEEAQLVDDITAEIRQIKDATPDGEPSIANQKDEPSEELQGSLIENVAIDFENPDYYIPDSSAYVPSQEEPDENGYTDNPQILATDYEEADLIMQMLEGITDGSGAALLNFGDITTEVPIEAIRDALQLQGINTNDILVDLKRESNDMSEEPELAQPSGLSEQIFNQKIKDRNGGEFELNLVKIDDVYEGALINKENGRIQIVVRNASEREAKKVLREAGAYIKQAANGDEAMDDGVIPNLDRVESPVSPANPRLQAHSQMIKDLIEQTGNTIDDDTADKIRDAIDDDWGINWSEATDEEIIEAIVEVAGPGILGREAQEDITPEVEDTPVDSADLPRDPSVDVPVDSPEYETPQYSYPGPREAGYTPNNVVLDSNGAAVGAGARVQALSDGRAGTVLAVQNIDTKSGRDADYVRIRFDDGSTAVRSARQIFGIDAGAPLAQGEGPGQLPPSRPNPVPQDPGQRFNEPAPAGTPVIAGDGSIPGVNLVDTPDDIAEFVNPDAKQADFAAWGLRAPEIARAGRERADVNKLVDLIEKEKAARELVSNASSADERDKARAERDKYEAQIKKVINDSFGIRPGVKFGKSNYTIGDGSRVDYTISDSGEVLFSIAFSIQDERGRRVGEGSRTVRGLSDTDVLGNTTRKWVVTNNLLKIYNKKDQKSGFASAYNRYMEDWYIANGFSSINVFAAGGGAGRADSFGQLMDLTGRARKQAQFQLFFVAC
jgi:hypothetical protein